MATLLTAVVFLLPNCRKNDCGEPGAYFSCLGSAFIGDTIAMVVGQSSPYNLNWTVNNGAVIVESGTSTATGSVIHVVINSTSTEIILEVVNECGNTSSYTRIVNGTPQYSGTWTQMSPAPFDGRRGAVGFSIGINGYVCSGYDFSGAGLNDLWEWNQANNTWTQKASLPAPGRYDAVGFALNGKGYVGLGISANNWTSYDDFWEWNPATNQWTARAQFPGGTRSGAVAVACGNYGYVGTGNQNGSDVFDFWRFDPGTNSWMQRLNLGVVGRSHAVAFSSNTKVYVAGGTCPSYPGVINDFYEYDPLTDMWTQKASLDFPRRSAAACFCNGKGYLITGIIDVPGFGSMGTNSVLEYDPVADTWTNKRVLGSTMRISPIAFSIGNLIYAGTGNCTYSYENDLWELTP